MRSTRRHRAGRSSAQAARAALVILLQVGFTEPPQSPASLVVSYTTVSPLPRSSRGGLFSVALSRGSPRVGVTHHLCPVESGLSSTDRSRPRPPGRLVPAEDSGVTQLTVSHSPVGHPEIKKKQVGRRHLHRTNPPPFLAMEGDSSSDQFLGVSPSATDATCEFGSASGLFGYQLRYSRSLVDSLVRRIALFRPNRVSSP